VKPESAFAEPMNGTETTANSKIKREIKTFLFFMAHARLVVKERPRGRQIRSI
jgi:hypothetical protein